MKRGLWFLLTILLLLVSCDDHEDDYNLLPALMIEGWIEDGGFPVVMLTKSLPISEEYRSVVKEEDMLIRWAKVSISDGDTTVVLTGLFHNGYFPPFIYTTGDLRGKCGRTYTLRVEYDDYLATATATIPPSPTLDSFKIEKVGNSDTLRMITACFTDDPTVKNYYQFFSRTGGENRQFLASYLGSIDDAVLNGYAEIPVYQGHSLRKSYSPYFSINDTVAIKFTQVDEATFHFWDEYTKAQTLSTNFFFSSSAQIHSNIQGGFGFWGAYGSTTYYFLMRDYQ